MIQKTNIGLRSVPSGITLTPSSGSGDTSVAVKASSVHTGRVAKTSQATGQVVGGTSGVTVNITESPKPLFVSLSSASTVIEAEGGNVNLTGTSNAAKLTFAIDSDDIGLAAITNYTAAGVSATSGTAITGDPGASAQYSFSVSIPVSEQKSIEDLISTIKVTPDDTSASAVTFTITQSAADPYLYLNAEGTTTASVTLAQSGAAVNVQVLSNTNWSFAE